MAKTVVAMYDTFESAQRAVEALVEAGHPRSSISLLASDNAGTYSRFFADRQATDNLDRRDDDVSAGEGAGFGAVIGTLVGLAVALIPGIGPVIAVGPFAAALLAGIGAAAGALTGGVVAGLIDLGIDEDDADVYAEGLRQGGALVAVSATDADTDRVEAILNQHDPIDIDERAGVWRDTGWAGFSDDAEPLTGEQRRSQSETRSSMRAYREAGAGQGETTHAEPAPRAFRDTPDQSYMSEAMQDDAEAYRQFGHEDRDAQGNRQGGTLSSSMGGDIAGSDTDDSLMHDEDFYSDDSVAEDAEDHVQNQQTATTFGQTGVTLRGGRRGGARTYDSND